MRDGEGRVRPETVDTPVAAQDAEMQLAFGDSFPSELIATHEARLAHLRMVVRVTLKAMASERWDAALSYLVDGFEREEHARRRQEGEHLPPYWTIEAKRQSVEGWKAVHRARSNEESVG